MAAVLRNKVTLLKSTPNLPGSGGCWASETELAEVVIDGSETMSGPTLIGVVPRTNSPTAGTAPAFDRIRLDGILVDEGEWVKCGD